MKLQCQVKVHQTDINVMWLFFKNSTTLILSKLPPFVVCVWE